MSESVNMVNFVNIKRGYGGGNMFCKMGLFEAENGQKQNEFTKQIIYVHPPMKLTMFTMFTRPFFGIFLTVQDLKKEAFIP